MNTEYTNKTVSGLPCDYSSLGPYWGETTVGGPVSACSPTIVPVFGGDSYTNLTGGVMMSNPMIQPNLALANPMVKMYAVDGDLTQETTCGTYSSFDTAYPLVTQQWPVFLTNSCANNNLVVNAVNPTPVYNQMINTVVGMKRPY